MKVHAVATPVSNLYDRFSRAAERGRGIQLTPADLDLLVVTGVYEAICLESVREMREIAKARIASRQAEPEPPERGGNIDRAVIAAMTSNA
jgi:hypothetical protein